MCFYLTVFSTHDRLIRMQPHGKLRKISTLSSILSGFQQQPMFKYQVYVYAFLEALSGVSGKKWVCNESHLIRFPCFPNIFTCFFYLSKLARSIKKKIKPFGNVNSWLSKMVQLLVQFWSVSNLTVAHVKQQWDWSASCADNKRCSGVENLKTIINLTRSQGVLLLFLQCVSSFKLHQ